VWHASLIREFISRLARGVPLWIKSAIRNAQGASAPAGYAKNDRAKEGANGPRCRKTLRENSWRENSSNSREGYQQSLATPSRYWFELLEQATGNLRGCIRLARAVAILGRGRLAGDYRAGNRRNLPVRNLPVRNLPVRNLPVRNLHDVLRAHSTPRWHAQKQQRQ